MPSGNGGSSALVFRQMSRNAVVIQTVTPNDLWMRRSMTLSTSSCDSACQIAVVNNPTEHDGYPVKCERHAIEGRWLVDRRRMFHAGIMREISGGDLLRRQACHCSASLIAM